MHDYTTASVVKEKVASLVPRRIARPSRCSTSIALRAPRWDREHVHGTFPSADVLLQQLQLKPSLGCDKTAAPERLVGAQQTLFRLAAAP